MSADDLPPTPPRTPAGLASLAGLWDDCDDFVDDVQAATTRRSSPRALPELRPEPPFADEGKPQAEAD